jgi:hypothetical protein
MYREEQTNVQRGTNKCAEKANKCIEWNKQMYKEEQTNAQKGTNKCLDRN